MVGLVAASSCVPIDLTTYCDRNPNAPACLPDGGSDIDGGAEARVPDTDGSAEEAGADADLGACTPDARACAGEILRTCEGGRWTERICELGCERGGCNRVVDFQGASAGEGFCVAVSDGQVRCWGSNADGTPSVGKRAFRRPSRVNGISGAVQVGAGETYFAARLNDGSVVWWGRHPGLRQVEWIAPTKVPGLTGVLELSVGDWHMCGKLSGGTLRCWGDGRFGQLADGTTSNSFPPQYATVSVSPGANSIVAGYQKTFVVTAAGAEGWGGNNSGSLGGPPLADAVTSPVKSFAGALDVAIGGIFACARRSGGDIACAGGNSYGSLGRGDTIDSSTPVAVAGLSGVKQVVAGWFHACALGADSTVSCWGGNEYGALGTPGITQATQPLRVSGLSDVRRLASAGHTTCALQNDEVTILCWGANSAGSVGADLDPATTPIVATPSKVRW
jgi:alpha-tubulin suppressor-like RCC1 family protein